MCLIFIFFCMLLSSLLYVLLYLFFFLIFFFFFFFFLFYFVFFFFFFFQAEDGIRDKLVTGVQTCALPILRYGRQRSPRDSTSFLLGSIFPNAIPKPFRIPKSSTGSTSGRPSRNMSSIRSEERRVGKECRSRWSPER